MNVKSFKFLTTLQLKSRSVDLNKFTRAPPIRCCSSTEHFNILVQIYILELFNNDFI